MFRCLERPNRETSCQDNLFNHSHKTNEFGSVSSKRESQDDQDYVLRPHRASLAVKLETDIKGAW